MTQSYGVLLFGTPCMEWIYVHNRRQHESDNYVLKINSVTLIRELWQTGLGLYFYWVRVRCFRHVVYNPCHHTLCSDVNACFSGHG